MTIYAQIISHTSEPLPNASINLVDAKGNYLGEGVKADNTGKFSLTSNALKGNQVLITYVGMQPVFVDPDLLTAVDYTQVVLYPKTEKEATVTPKVINALWIFGLIALGVILRKKGKKRKN